MSSTLNEQQEKAVLHRDGPVLIYAGAGSGKTLVMCHSIANMLRTGVPGSAVFAVTFTNKAAKELKERVDSLVGFGTRNILISTFHSACVRFLRLFAHEIEFNKNFSIYDDSEKTSVLKSVIADVQHASKILTPAQLESKLDQLKNAGISPEKYLEKITSEYMKKDSETFRKYGEMENFHIIQKCYALFQERMKSQNAMDFGDLLMNAVLLLEKFPRVLEELQFRFSHFLVDEFQDTNPVQFKFISLLSSHTRNLRVVGDDDQSIYSWRGAEPAFILSFSKYYPDATIYKLEKNYRSTGAIIEAAAAVIKHNRCRTDKNLWTDKDFGSRIILKATYNVQEEASFVVESILKKLANGISLSSIAILYRTNNQSRALEDELRRHMVPYVIYGSVRFYERAEIKTLMSYLKLLTNPFDDVAFRRAITNPKTGFGEKGLQKLKEAADSLNIALFKAAILVEKNELKLEVARGVSGLKTFASRFQQWLAAFENQKPVSQILEQILSEIEFQKYLAANFPDDYDERWLNVIELRNALVEFENSKEKNTPNSEILSEFIHNAMLVVEPTSVDVEKGSAEAISLLTIHAAKGLEFEHVFLVGLEEGTLPHFRSIDDPVSIEEERRLMYVAITRAKTSLTMSRSRFDMYRNEMRVPSRFLSEIPEECVESLSKHTDFKKNNVNLHRELQYISEDN